MEARKKPRFLRRCWNMLPKLGGRRKKLKWRAANGRHNKIREKRKNRPRMPGVGYRNPKQIRGLINGMNPVYITNLNDLSKIKKDDIAIVSGTLGKKKKIELAKQAKDIKFLNFNPEKFLQEIKIEQEKKKQEQPKTEKKEERKDKKEQEKKKEIIPEKIEPKVEIKPMEEKK